MTDLKELLEEIKLKKAKIATEKDLETVDNPHTYRSKMAHITRAKSDLEDHIEAYRMCILKSVAFILVTGKNTDKFNSIASEEFGCFEVGADEMYEKMIKDVPESLYLNHTLPAEVFTKINYTFQEMASELDIVSYVPMSYEHKHKKMIKSKDELLKIVKDAFNTYTGSEVVGLYAVNSILNTALKAEYDNPVTPIILHSTDETLIKDLANNLNKITNNVFVVSAGGIKDEQLKVRATVSMKSVTSKQVEEGLLTIKNLI